MKTRNEIYDLKVVRKTMNYDIDNRNYNVCLLDIVSYDKKIYVVTKICYTF